MSGIPSNILWAFLKNLIRLQLVVLHLTALIKTNHQNKTLKENKTERGGRERGDINT